MAKKFTVAVLFVLCLLNQLGAQSTILSDDFESGLISSWTENVAGHWTASTLTPLNGSFSLKHNLSSVTGSSWISRQLSTDPSAGNMTWEFQMKNGNWDPSSLNRYWFYLLSDQSDISLANGYAVGINLTGASDQISLYRTSGGAFSATLITTATANFNWDANGWFGFRITRSSAGLWELLIDDNGGFDNLVSVGTASDATLAPVNPWMGTFFEYTSTRAGQLWVDDILVQSTAGSVPVLNLSLGVDSVREGETSVLNLSSSVPMASAKTLALTVTGTAGPGSDLVAIPATLTLPAGQTLVTFDLETFADAIFEDTEFLDLQLGKNGETGFVFADSSQRLYLLDYVRVMTYNLLFYPTSSSISQKNQNLRPILKYLKPDIFGINELDSTGGQVSADSILDHALNVGTVSSYQAAAYDNAENSPLTNMLFYNGDKFGLASQGTIFVPGNRDPHFYRLFLKYPDLPVLQDTIWTTIIQCHFKAGSNASDEAQRAQTADSIMNWIQANNPVNCLLMGDLNLYSNTEVAFQTLTNYSNSSLNFYDPINQVGAWTNNAAYAPIHTQSSRLGSEPDGGAFGGMDDRFDFILSSSAPLSGADSMIYLPGTYHAVGQDGLRFNQSINSPVNNSLPAGLADNLYYMSDHLPVVAGFQYNYPVVPFLALHELKMKAEPVADGIELRWDELADAGRYELWERDPNGDFLPLAQLGDWIHDYLDHWDQAGAWREYRLLAFDAEGKLLASDEVRVNALAAKIESCQVFPNPANGWLRIELSPLAGEIHAVRLRDISGKCLGEWVGSGVSSQKLDLGRFEAGSYVLEVSNSRQVFHHRIILLN